MVQVTRDKQRHGTIQEIVNNRTVGIKFDSAENTAYFDVDRIEAGIVVDDLFEENDVAIKHDNNKPRLELIPASGIDAAGRAMTYGSKKYADHNWANGFDWDRLTGSLMRHLQAWRSGEDVDPESGLNHVDHICANSMMLAAHVNEGLGNDNRRKTIK